MVMILASWNNADMLQLARQRELKIPYIRNAVGSNPTIRTRINKWIRVWNLWKQPAVCLFIIIKSNMHVKNEKKIKFLCSLIICLEIVKLAG